MSDRVAPESLPWLILPGFMPDAAGFATRTALALLLAYGIAFTIQLDSASSAGICVAIVAQPTSGMAMSKAIYRVIGTLLGGAVGLALVSALPQDRTMLLAAFTLWLGLCTFVASLLRDFRSYGAVLCGYTVGIVAIGGIDAPGGALLATLNRVAAILVGVACVAVVNALLSRAGAFENLVAALRDRLAAAEALALSALAGHDLPDEPLPAQVGASILELRVVATYAMTEMPGGRARRAGAEAAIAGLLGMLTASRSIATGMRVAVDPPTRSAMDDAAARLLRTGGEVGYLDRLPSLPNDANMAALIDRADEVLAQHALVLRGMQALVDGRALTATVRLPFHYDVAGAATSAVRTLIAVGLGCVVSVYGGWPGVTLLLIQQSAFTALLGMQPNPFAAGVAMGISLPIPALAAGLVGFVVLPLASGFVPFALAVGPVAFLLALTSRHPATARFGPGLLLYFTLLLAPDNTESFDLQAFLNTTLVQVLAILMMVLAFRLILPVSRRRRWARVADAIGRSLRRALDGHAPHDDPIAARCLRVDRLAQAQVWLGRPTRARLAVLSRLSAFTELDGALQRAQVAMAALGRAMPPPDPAAMEAEAHAVLAGDPAPQALHAAAGLHGAAVLLRRHGPALRRYGVT